MTTRRAIVLLSGGLDSATVAAMALRDGFAVHALTVRYGQRHAAELDAAARIAASLGISPHTVVDVDLRAIGGSALTTDIPVPLDREHAAIGRGIPATYVPARNTVLLSLALALAETTGALDLFIGANEVDFSGYPDCRPEFLAAFERLADAGTRAGADGARFRVHAPLIALSKREIIERGTALGVDYALTLSCYDPSPDGAACGRCDACRLRLRGFREAGLADPARYRAATA